MTMLTTEIEINASASTIWKILMDFDAYSEWNSFISPISSSAEEGKIFQTKISPPNGKEMTFKPKVLEVTPNKAFRWLGKLLIPGIFDGEHQFLLEEIEDNKVRFIHQEKFGGILFPLLWRSIGKSTEEGFKSFNEDLKRRAEA